MSEHERSDIHPGGVAWGGVALLVFVLAVLSVSAGLDRLFTRLDQRSDRQRQRQEPGAASLVRAEASYGGPLLQVLPEDELAAMRAADARELGEYAWADKASGAVRIPIDRAMRLLVDRGLPAAPGAPVTLEQLQQKRGNNPPATP